MELTSLPSPREAESSFAYLLQSCRLGCAQLCVRSGLSSLPWFVDRFGTDVER